LVGFLFLFVVQFFFIKNCLLLDALIGLPAVYSHGIDLQLENERSKFLVIELSPHVNLKKIIFKKKNLKILYY
jgi:hypothetical protein